MGRLQRLGLCGLRAIWPGPVGLACCGRPARDPTRLGYRAEGRLGFHPNRRLPCKPSPPLCRFAAATQWAPRRRPLVPPPPAGMKCRAPCARLLFFSPFFLSVPPLRAPAAGRHLASAGHQVSEERPSAAGSHVPRRIPGLRSVAATQPRVRAGEEAADVEEGAASADGDPGAPDVADAAIVEGPLEL